MDLYRQNFHGEIVPPWTALFSTPPDIEALQKIAADERQESLIRALAFLVLRTEKQPVTPKIYLGTIIEAGLPGGADTLAVFADRGALHQPLRENSGH